MPKVILLSIILVIFSFIKLQDVSAADCSLTLSQTTFPYDFNGTINITSKEPCFQSTVKYYVIAYPIKHESSAVHIQRTFISEHLNPQADNKTFSVPIKLSGNLDGSFQKGKLFPGGWNLKICHADSVDKCDPTKILATGKFEVSPTATTPLTAPATSTQDLPIVRKDLQRQCGYQTGEGAEVAITNAEPNLIYEVYWKGEKKGLVPAKGSASPSLAIDETSASIYNSSFTIKIPGSVTASATGKKTLCVDIARTGAGARNTAGGLFREGHNCIDLNFYVKPPTTTEKSCNFQPSTTCTPGSPECPTSAGVRCNTISGVSVKSDDATGDGILTAIGCVPTEPKALIQGLLRVSSVAGGGIALLLMIAGSFQMITSAGDQHKLQAGREQFSNAIIGLLFIIFSVLLLRIIGVDILGLLV